MPDYPGGRRSSLRMATRTVELRNRLRQATMVTEDREGLVVSPRHRSLWETYKHYFCAMGGAVVGGVSVLVVTSLLAGSPTASPSELAKMTNPMMVAVDRALFQAESLIQILEGIVGERQPKAHLDASENKSEYQNCLENCAKRVQVDDESDKWLLINCRNECISQYSKRVKETRKPGLE
jgi:hypothetical protein